MNANYIDIIFCSFSSAGHKIRYQGKDEENSHLKMNSTTAVVVFVRCFSQFFGENEQNTPK
jgi:hypothetical protein